MRIRKLWRLLRTGVRGSWWGWRWEGVWI